MSKPEAVTCVMRESERVGAIQRALSHPVYYDGDMGADIRWLLRERAERLQMEANHQAEYNAAVAVHLADQVNELLAALKTLRIDANRLCDRQLGGSYEDDCRRSIAFADAAIAKAEGK